MKTDVALDTSFVAKKKDYFPSPFRQVVSPIRSWSAITHRISTCTNIILTSKIKKSREYVYGTCQYKVLSIINIPQVKWTDTT